MRRSLVLILAALAGACGDSSYDEQIIYPANALEAGRVRLVPVAAVGSDEMPGVLCGLSTHYGSGSAALLPRGGLAVRGCDCGNVMLFDATGEFDRTLGRCGEGPGELNDFRTLDVGRDELIVTGASKMVRYSLPDGAVIGEATLPARATIRGVLPTGLYVLGYTASATETSIYGLHLHRPDGTHVRSFYEIDTKVSRPEWVAALELLHVVVDDEGFIWTVRAYNRFEVQKWDAEGRLVARFDEAPDWFPPYPGNFTPYRSMIHGAVWRDDRLWLIGQHPEVFDPDKLRGLGTDIADIFSFEGEILGVVEVLDAATGATIVRQTYDSLLVQGGTRGHFYRHPVPRDETVRVEFLRPELIDE